MRCFQCERSTQSNAMDDLEQDEYDQVVEAYVLIRLQGPEDMFDKNDHVVICPFCVQDALEDTRDA